MRLAFLATSYPRVPGDAAGHFVRAEARAAVRAGHEVHVIAPGVRADEGIVGHTIGGGDLFGWPGAAARVRARPARLVGLPAFWRDARRVIDALQPERTIAHWLVPSAYPLLRADEIVCHGADVRLLLSLPLPLRTRIVRRTLRRAERVRFVARSLRDGLLAACDDETAALLLARGCVVPPAIDVDERDAPDREVLPARFVVAAGRFVDDKRFDWAIEACSAARVPLVLLGDGPREPALRHRARATPGQVVFVGRVSRPRALGILAAAAVLIHPSASEAAPTVVLEARALGVPVVATPAGDVARWAARDPEIHVGEDVADLARLLARVLHAAA